MSPMSADVDQLEAQALVPDFENAQESARPRRRLPWMLSTAALLIGVVVVLASEPRRQGMTTSADEEGEVLELASSEWSGGPSPLHSAELHGAGLRTMKDKVAKPQVCKEPQPTTVCQTSGLPCQSIDAYQDRADCTIVQYNLHISQADLAYLNNDPKAGDYVPCNFTVNYNQNTPEHEEMYFTGAQCRYKGSTGSFMGCVDGKGVASTRNKDCRQLSLKVSVSKAVNAQGKTGKKVLGIKKLQFQGMMHDDSLARNHIGYSILHELDIVASCTVPANLFINGKYNGVSDLTEQVDEMFTENRFPNDGQNGKGTLWKEMWPVSGNPDYYKNVQPIDGFASQEWVAGADPHYQLFADLYNAASACFLQQDLLGNSHPCTEARASEILETYTHPESFIDGILGMTLTANSDQIIIIHHNFYFYVMDDKFYYISWDYNQVLFDITGGPIPGYNPSLPWYVILDDIQRKKMCPYPVPSNSSDMTIKRFNQFTCDPVGYIMGLAWKDRYLAKVKHAGAIESELSKEMSDELTTWQARLETSITCDAANGGWPTSVQESQKAAKPLAPMYSQILGFWKAVEAKTLIQWPSPTFADFPEQVTSCFFDGIQAAQYLGHAGIQITDGVRDCPHAPAGSARCATDISNVISSFGFVGTFISTMLTECPITDSSGFATRGIGHPVYDGSVQADCAAGALRVVSGLAAASAGASGLSEMCVPGVARTNRGMPPARRLTSVGFVPSVPTEKATCSFDVMGAMAYLARAAMVIDMATTVCSKPYHNPAMCSAQVTAVIESFSYLAMYLADSVAQCSKEINYPIDDAFKATCAADIAQLNGALLSVASGGSSMAVSCGKPWPEEAPYNVRSVKRHLTHEEYVNELEASKAAFHDVVEGDHRKLKEWVGKQASLDKGPIEFGLSADSGETGAQTVQSI